MSEPDWKQELRDWAALWVSDPFEASALDALMPHIEAAYQRGLMAGRSQAGYGTRRKKKEGQCTAGAAGNTPASNTEVGDEG